MRTKIVFFLIRIASYCTADLKGEHFSPQPVSDQPHARRYLQANHGMKKVEKSSTHCSTSNIILLSWMWPIYKREDSVTGALHAELRRASASP